MAYYVFAEDLVGGLVGPFETVDLAREHIAFCEARGDADAGRVMTSAEADALLEVGRAMFVIAPEDDRRSMIDACLSCGVDQTGHSVCPTCGEETVPMTAAFFAEGLAEIAAEASEVFECRNCRTSYVPPAGDESGYCSPACRAEDEAERAADDPTRPGYYGREGSSW